MKKNSVKGFTLIELLAVIIIMGVLMMTAIPAVTRYIENSRKDTFWQTAKSYIDAARTPLLSGEYGVKYYNGQTSGLSTDIVACEVPPVGKVTVVPLSIIQLEKGGSESSFNRSIAKSGTTERGFVLAVNEGSGTTDKIVYYFAGIDAGGNGIDTFTKESSLGRSVVKKGTANKADLTALNTLVNATSTAEKTVTLSTFTLATGLKTKVLYEVCK